MMTGRSELGKLAEILAGGRPAAIYRSTARASAAAIARLAEAHGWRCFYLAGRQIADKADFLRVWSEVAVFPSYFGRNWDALDESLRDLAWAPAQGYLVLYDNVAHFAAAQPAEFAVALDVLQTAVEHWQATPTPMAVLLRGAGRTLRSLPKL